MTACAFVVGIDEYPAASGMGPLKAAVADAAEFAEWVLADDGGNVAQDRLHFWAWPPVLPARAELLEGRPLLAAHLDDPTPWFQGDPALAAPTDAQIAQSIFQVMVDAGQQGITRVYVYLAGHGIQVDRQIITETPQSCFMAGDYVARFADGLIACDELQQALERIGPAEVVLLFDCCRSELDPTTERPHLGWPNYVAAGRERMAAGRATRSRSPALEVTTPSGIRGAFSHLVTFALRNLRIDGRLTAEQLENFVRSAMPALVAPRRQLPDFRIDPRGDDGLVLVEGPPQVAGFPLRLRFNAANQGRTAYLKDADLAVVAAFDAAPGEAELMLPLGRYALEYEGENISKSVPHFGIGSSDADV